MRRIDQKTTRAELAVFVVELLEMLAQGARMAALRQGRPSDWARLGKEATEAAAAARELIR